MGATAFLCCTCLAQSGRPDFSGNWKLDVGKSSTWKVENGKTSREADQDGDYVQTIQQSATKITVSTKAQGVTNVLDGTFPIDGKQHMSTLKPGTYRFTKVGWDPGNTLVFEIYDKDGKKETSKVIGYVRESWTLSHDGKVLTKSGKSVEAGKPLFDQKYVLNKQ